MKNKKEFIGIFLSVMISVFLVGLGVYATTTISSNIVTEGVAALGTSTASTSYKLYIEPETANAINLGLINQNGQMGIYASVSVDSDTDDTYVYGMYNDINVGTGVPSNLRRPVGVYNNIDVETTLSGVLAFPAGVYNEFKASAMGMISQVAGIKTSSDNYSTQMGVTQDANYIALMAGGLNSQVRGSRTELYLKNDDGVQQAAYVNKAAIFSAGTADKAYGYYIDDYDSDITGGTAYGVYIDFDDTDWDTAYSVYVAPGSADSYFGSSIIIPTESLQVAHTVSAAYSRFGSGTTGHGLDAANDLLVSDDLEIDGTSFFDGLVSVSDANGLQVGGGATIKGGTASPSGSCAVGDIYIDSSGSSGTGANRIMSICDVTNEWSAVTVE